MSHSLTQRFAALAAIGVVGAVGAVVLGLGPWFAIAVVVVGTAVVAYWEGRGGEQSFDREWHWLAILSACLGFLAAMSALDGDFGTGFAVFVIAGAYCTLLAVQGARRDTTRR